MDFFQQQTEERNKSSLLVALYMAGMLAMALVASAVLSLFLYPLLMIVELNRPHPLLSFNGTLFLAITVIILGVCLTISYLRYRQLLGGGWQVAKALGGRRLSATSHEPMEKRACNVVEEMAIASGMPVPALYLLDNEEGINGFAAGMGSCDSVIAITNGALQALNRDELQALIAHEFSHIRNGDIRLNMYLAAGLGGLLFIANLVNMLDKRIHTHSGENREGILASSCNLLGYGGVLFSELLKAAVNRRREILADASAVQFTRHPLALANALKKVAGHPYASLILHPAANQYSHLFFSQGQNRSFSGPLASHPQLRERIQALQPDWDGMYIRGGLSNWFDSQQAEDEQPLTTREQKKAEQQVELGNLDLDAPEGWLHRLPSLQLEAARDLQQAPLLIYALLLSPDLSPRHRQLMSVPDKERVDELSHLDLPRRLKLALLELSISTLTQLPASEYPPFRQKLHELMMADNQISQFEWALYHLLSHQLDRYFCPQKMQGQRIRDLALLREAIATISCGIARLCHRNEPERALFVQEIAAFLGMDITWSDTVLDWHAMDHAIEMLQSASPGVQLRLVQAIGKAMEEDGEISDDEFELFRVIAITLDCPVPPPQPGLMKRRQEA